MRWILRVAAVLVILVGVVAVVFKTSVHSSPCPMVGLVPSAAFVGTVVSKDGADVVVRVDELDTDPAVVMWSTRQPEIGEEVVVHYDRGDQRLVHQGQRYHVSAYDRQPDGPEPDPGELDDETTPGQLHSTVHRAGECAYPLGVGTTYADGSTIGANFFSRDGIEPYRVPLGIGGMAVATIGLLIAWRIRQRRRIDTHAVGVDPNPDPVSTATKPPLP